jgi:hypothetical protein
MEWTGLLRSQGFQSNQSRSAGPHGAKGGLGLEADSKESHGSKARHWYRSPLVPLRVFDGPGGRIGPKSPALLNALGGHSQRPRVYSGFRKSGVPFEILSSAREEAPFLAVFD